MTEETKAAILLGRALSTTLISGPTGRGKTSLFRELVKHLWRKQRRLSRLYITDGGGGIVGLQALAEKGVLQTFRLRSRVSIGAGSRDLAFETCHRATQGWWPRAVDPVTGIAAPSVEMVPPVTQTLRMYCPQGHLIAEEQVEAKLTPRACAKCGEGKKLAPGAAPEKYGKATPGVRVQSSSSTTPGFEQVGAVLFDGITSMCDWTMTDLADRSARKELGGEDAAIGGIVKSGSMDFTGNNRSHYQLSQSIAERWLVTSGAIPGLVIPAIWTSLEVPGKTEDGEGREWGPQIAGSAKTGKVPSWVGNYLGCQLVEGERGREEFRLYLRSWVGPDGLRHPYKHRTDPRDMPEYLSDWNHDEIREYLPDWEFSGDPGTPFSGFNLAIFFALLERSVQRRLAEDDLGETPGLPQGGVLEVGGAARFEADDQARFRSQDPAQDQAAATGQPQPVATRPQAQARPGGPPTGKAPSARVQAGAVVKPGGAQVAAAVKAAPAQAQAPPPTAADPGEEQVLEEAQAPQAGPAAPPVDLPPPPAPLPATPAQVPAARSQAPPPGRKPGQAPPPGARPAPRGTPPGTRPK